MAAAQHWAVNRDVTNATSGDVSRTVVRDTGCDLARDSIIRAEMPTSVEVQIWGAC